MSGDRPFFAIGNNSILTFLSLLAFDVLQLKSIGSYCFQGIVNEISGFVLVDGLLDGGIFPSLNDLSFSLYLV